MLEFICSWCLGMAGALLTRWRDRYYFNVAALKEFSCELVTVQDCDQPTSIIMWIHGTWNKSGFSTHHELISKLRNEYSAALIVAFNWHAPNNHNQRNGAAQALVVKLNELLRTLPQRPVYLIGHSHGGQVAMTAASLLAEEASDVRVITLATPFIEQVSNARVALPLASLAPFLLLDVLVTIIVAWIAYAYGVSFVPIIIGLMGSVTIMFIDNQTQTPNS